MSSFLQENVYFGKNSNKVLISCKRAQQACESYTISEPYKLYIRPHLDYGDFIYHDPPKICELYRSFPLSNLMEKLESVKDSAALAVSGTRRGTPREKLYAELGWEFLSLRRWSRRLTLFYRIVNNLAPNLTRDPIPPQQQSQYFLRKHHVIGQELKSSNLRFIHIVCLNEMHLKLRLDLRHLLPFSRRKCYRKSAPLESHL